MMTAWGLKIWHPIVPKEELKKRKIFFCTVLLNFENELLYDLLAIRS